MSLRCNHFERNLAEDTKKTPKTFQPHSNFLNKSFSISIPNRSFSHSIFFFNSFEFLSLPSLSIHHFPLKHFFLICFVSSDGGGSDIYRKEGNGVKTKMSYIELQCSSRKRRRWKEILKEELEWRLSVT